MQTEIPSAPEPLFSQSSHLQTLNEIGRVVSSTLDLRTLYDTIYLQIGRVMDTTHFFVALHRPDRNSIQVSYLREEGNLFLNQEPQAAGTKHVTVSIGMALLDAEDQSEELFTRADLAMYQVKYEGGNRVCIADSPFDFRFRQAAG